MLLCNIGQCVQYSAGGFYGLTMCFAWFVQCACSHGLVNFVVLADNFVICFVPAFEQ